MFLLHKEDFAVVVVPSSRKSSAWSWLSGDDLIREMRCLGADEFQIINSAPSRLESSSS